MDYLLKLTPNQCDDYSSIYRPAFINFEGVAFLSENSGKKMKKIGKSFSLLAKFFSTMNGNKDFAPFMSTIDIYGWKLVLRQTTFP